MCYPYYQCAHVDSVFIQQAINLVMPNVLMGQRFINVTPGCKYVYLKSILQTALLRDVNVTRTLLVLCSFRQTQHDFMDEFMCHSLLHLLLISTRSSQSQRKESVPKSLIGLGAHWAFETTAGSRHSALFSAVNSMKTKTRGNRYWHFLSFFGWISFEFHWWDQISTNCVQFNKWKKGY